MDSRRLPGKALTDIAGRPLLGRVLDRIRMVPGDYTVVVATSDREIDSGIAEFAAAENITVFRGVTENVAQRLVDCADAHGFRRVARISGDSPFIDPGLVGRFLQCHDERGAELVTNVMPRTFPPGLSVEIISVEALRRMIAETRDPADLEHVTRFIYANPERFDIHNIRAENDDSDLALTVDTAEDLERARWVVSHLGEAPEQAALQEVVALARRWFSNNGNAGGRFPGYG